MINRSRTICIVLTVIFAVSIIALFFSRNYAYNKTAERFAEEVPAGSCGYAVEKTDLVVWSSGVCNDFFKFDLLISEIEKITVEKRQGYDTAKMQVVVYTPAAALRYELNTYFFDPARPLLKLFFKGKKVKYVGTVKSE